MALNEYQHQAQRTEQITPNMKDKIINGCIGRCSEIGECVDILKSTSTRGIHSTASILSESWAM